MSSQEELQQQLMAKARQQQLQMIAARQQATISNQTQPGTQPQQMQPQPQTMARPYDDIPITCQEDYDFLNGQVPRHLSSYRSACDGGPISTIQSLVTSEIRSPAFLHLGLTIALSAGNVEAVRYLLKCGAPIARQTAHRIFLAPEGARIHLFDLFAQNGWTPNTPGYYGAVLLPEAVTNLQLLEWFLTHGANPNLGPQRDFYDRNGGPDTDSCAALEKAAARGSLEAVQMLLQAGAKIEYGTPLHYAAGVCPSGTNPHSGPVVPGLEFDSERIPIMKLLVEAGADVNQKFESRHMTPQYPIIYAVMAGAVERVKWLLAHGADPHARGSWGSAVECAKMHEASDEMRAVLGIA